MSTDRTLPIQNAKTLAGGEPEVRVASAEGATTKTEELCKMFFIVGYNSKGYFVYNGYGNECHNDHNPALDNLQNFSTKNIDPKDLEIADVLQKTNNSAGVIRNVLNHNTGRILSVHNITYLMKKLKGSPLEKTLR